MPTTEPRSVGGRAADRERRGSRDGERDPDGEDRRPDEQPGVPPAGRRGAEPDRGDRERRGGEPAPGRPGPAARAEQPDARRDRPVHRERRRRRRPSPSSAAWSGRKGRNPAMPHVAHRTRSPGSTAAGWNSRRRGRAARAGGRRHRPRLGHEPAPGRRGQREHAGPDPDRGVVAAAEDRLADHRADRQPEPQRERHEAERLAASGRRARGRAAAKHRDEEGRLADAEQRRGRR